MDILLSSWYMCIHYFTFFCFLSLCLLFDLSVCVLNQKLPCHFPSHSLVFHYHSFFFSGIFYQDRYMVYLCSLSRWCCSAHSQSLGFSQFHFVENVSFSPLSRVSSLSGQFFYPPVFMGIFWFSINPNSFHKTLLVPDPPALQKSYNWHSTNLCSDSLPVTFIA